MSVTTDIRKGVRMDIEARKGATFTRQYHAMIYSGSTLIDYDLEVWTGATIEVRRKANSPVIELSFSTADSTITLGTEGRFVLALDYDTMDGIRAGEYVYDMYLSNASTPKRDFVYGNFTIYDKITR